MRKIIFNNDCLYHIYNRGVDKRNVFDDSGDYIRFINILKQFNKTARVCNFVRNLDRGSTSLTNDLVEILCFCLMPNHYHLIIQQTKECGITKFMHKLGTGYTMYYNAKNKRSGSLFQGRFKANIIEDDEYLLHLSRYIHLNPLKLFKPMQNKKREKFEFLEKYKWSSYQDYMLGLDARSFLNKKIILNYFNNEPKKYSEFMSEVEPHSLEI